jgi:hypothetical protein
MMLLPSNVLFLLGHDHYYDEVAVTGIILLYNELVRQLLDGCCCMKTAFSHIVADDSARFNDSKAQ